MAFMHFVRSIGDFEHLFGRTRLGASTLSWGPMNPGFTTPWEGGCRMTQFNLIRLLVKLCATGTTLGMNILDRGLAKVANLALAMGALVRYPSHYVM